MTFLFLLFLLTLALKVTTLFSLFENERGGAGMCMRRGNHSITPTQVRQRLLLLNNNNRSRSRRRDGKRGKMVRRCGRGRNQKGGFIGWLIKHFMQIYFKMNKIFFF